MLRDWEKVNSEHYRSKKESEQPYSGGMARGKSEIFFTCMENQCYAAKLINGALIWKTPYNSRTATRKAIINYVKNCDF